MRVKKVQRRTNKVTKSRGGVMIKAFFQRLDRWIDNTWREFYAFVMYRIDSKKDEVDIDWLNMANDIKENNHER